MKMPLYPHIFSNIFHSLSFLTGQLKWRLFFFPSILLAIFLVVFFIFRFFFNESSWRASGDASDNHRSGRSSRGREEVGREGRQSTTSFVAETTPFPLAYAA